mmetsp:Transcript_6824/g.22658  ORF Transcript_6824/g.22658 Transcript_6824/m.22658 type:complete len:1580 (+) Transcript_6824:86-4825(+)
MSGSNAALVLAAGTRVWVEAADAAEAWASGEVVSASGESVEVKTSGGSVKQLSPEAVHLQEPRSAAGVEDMVKLSYLHEPGVLHNVGYRYSLDEIYTYTGEILIAVNPFQRLPHLYNQHMMDQYRGMTLGDLSPHVFAIADASYCAMAKENRSQSILVSGESGAGKTETTKLIMTYLAYMGGRTDGRAVEQQVLESNPLLEAFGNAKTVRNDNSSRFGKFVEIQFDKIGRISGAAVRTYLLERSRLVQIADPERNFHIFYQLCDGASPEEVEMLRLKPAKEFRYLNQSQCFDLAGVSNAEEYSRTRRAMSIVGLDDDQQEGIIRTVAAILHLGNCSFKEGDGGDGSQLDSPAAEEALESCAAVLRIPAELLRKALMQRTIETRDGSITKLLDVAAALNSRDSLAKLLYSRLFDWLVKKINTSIGQDEESTCFIGVLDIYGFESFKQNSFEQFCINLANEKLQQHFNQHVFKMEQEEYEREKIDWSYIDFVDNQDVLDLIESRPAGVLSLLDEACMVGFGKSEDFAQKLYQNHDRKHKRFIKPKRSMTDFAIKHYAGEVCYQTELFLEKNKDYIVAEHQNLVETSECQFLRDLFVEDKPAPPTNDSGPRRASAVKSSMKFASVGSRFKGQLAELMTQLHKTEPHYVRCIKPNMANKPGMFENANVLHQLRCGGVLEAIRISCAGYPSRKPWDEFVDRFGLLVPSLVGNADEPTLVRAICEKAELEGFQVGLTKVFLRAGQMAVLDSMRSHKLNTAATAIQKYVRRVLALAAFKRAKAAAVALQAGARGMAARTLARNLRRERAATQVQARVRGHQARRDFLRRRAAAILVQSAWRGFVARRALVAKRKERAALAIQSSWRGRSARDRFVRVRKAAVAFQSAWRAKQARREFRRLKQEQRETGALLKAKSELEKKVELERAKAEAEKRRIAELEERKRLDDERHARELEEMRLAVEEQKAQAVAEAEQRAKAAEVVAQAAAARAEVEATEARLAEVQADAEQTIETLTTKLEKVAGDSQAQVEKLMAELAETGDAKDKAEARARELDESREVLERENETLRERVRELERENEALTERAAHFAERANGLRKEELVKRIATPDGGKLSPAAAGGAGGSGGATPLRPVTNVPEAGLSNVSETNSAEDLDRQQAELDAKKARRNQEHQQAEQDLLLRCITEDIGFADGRPAAAVVIFRSLLHWRAFESERTQLFDRIIQTMHGAIEQKEENNEVLAYWLSNTATLLCFLQRTLKSTTGASAQTRRRSSTGIFDRLGMGSRFRSSPSQEAGGGAGGDKTGIPGVRQVEAKYPALLFKQQLTAFVEKIYGMLRDNVKKEITPQLGQCIQAPKRAGGAAERRTTRSPSAHGPTLSTHWRTILEALEKLSEVMRQNHVPSFLVRKFFTQVFSFINVQLFNSLLLRRECCSFSNGQYLQMGLAELEGWLSNAGEENVGAATDELRFIRQAVTLLVIHQKPKKTLNEITNDLCPVLTIQQLYRISTMYWDDKYGTETVSQDVLIAMKQKMMEESSSSMSNSFLLDDDSSIPFTAEEVSSNAGEVEHLSDEVPLPPILRDAQTFAFLKASLV